MHYQRPVTREWRPLHGDAVTRFTVGTVSPPSNYAQSGTNLNQARSRVAAGFGSDGVMIRASGAEPVHYQDGMYHVHCARDTPVSQRATSCYILYDNQGSQVPVSQRRYTDTTLARPTSYPGPQQRLDYAHLTGTYNTSGGPTSPGFYPSSRGFTTTMPDINNTGSHSASVVHTMKANQELTPSPPPPLPPEGQINGFGTANKTPTFGSQRDQPSYSTYNPDYNHVDNPTDLAPSDKAPYKLLIPLDDNNNNDILPKNSQSIADYSKPKSTYRFSQPDANGSVKVQKKAEPVYRDEKSGPASVHVSGQGKGVTSSTSKDEDSYVTGPVRTASGGAEIFNPGTKITRPKHPEVNHIQPKEPTRNSDWHIVPEKADIYYTSAPASDWHIVPEKADVYYPLGPAVGGKSSLVGIKGHSASVVIGDKQEVIRLPNNQLANVSTQHLGPRGPATPPPVAPEPVIVPVVPVAPPVIGNPDLRVQAQGQWRKDSPLTLYAYTGGVGEAEVTAEALSPSGHTSSIPVFKVSDETGEHHINFNPTEKGTWKVMVFYDRMEVLNSPFLINVYDPSQAFIVGNSDTAIPGQTYSFEVDCLQAGMNDVNVNVMHGASVIPHQVANAGIERTRVSFTPPGAGTYNITVFNGGVQIPGSPFDVNAHPTAAPSDVRASGDGLYNGIQGKELGFTVDVGAMHGKQLGVTIVAPSMDYVVPHISDRRDHFVVTYVPEEVGTHTVELSYNGQAHVAGSPYSVHVREPRIYVKHLHSAAYRNQRHTFEVDASEHSSGTIEIDSDLPVLNFVPVGKRGEAGERCYNITFLPRKLGEHDITLKFKDKMIDGSPFKVQVHEPQ